MSPAKPHPVSPLAPQSYPQLPAIGGVRFATAEAGIKYRGRTDVLMMVFDPGTQVAGVFTKSKCASAPVEWCRAQLGRGTARALVVNSGNANAFTGKSGKEASQRTAELAAAAVGCVPEDVFLSSTGVIGEPLDASRFEGVLEDCHARLADQPYMEAAKAIMTTDTYPKLAMRQVQVDGQTVTVAGMAKGAGMIAPDMATMLAYVFTDMPIAAPVLQDMLVTGVGPSFNSITVDSDTSTSDTLMAFATGTASARGVARLEDADDARRPALAEALEAVLRELALMIVRDGEGATKQVTVNVTGAVSDKSARRVARSIADSPLVKTAIAGQDANWGRVVMAVGKAGEPADRDLLTISFGDIVVAEKGARSPSYSEEAASAYMQNSEIEIGVDLGLGSGNGTIYTCDLTHAYIDINGSYRS